MKESRRTEHAYRGPAAIGLRCSITASVLVIRLAEQFSATAKRSRSRGPITIQSINQSTDYHSRDGNIRDNDYTEQGERRWTLSPHVPVIQHRTFGC